MKYSFFNTIIPISKVHTLIYNSLSEKFIVFKNKSVIIREGGEKALSEDYGISDYKRLQEAGAIISDDTDEIERLSNLISAMENNNDEYILHINPTLDCNFRCWYCYENHLSGSRMSPDITDAVKRFIHKTISSNKELKKFHLGFFGGEPFLYFDKTVRPILSYARDIAERYGVRLSCNFTTNGSLIRKKDIEFLKDFNPGFQITLDGGRECHDKVRFHKGGKGSYHEIISVVRTLAEYDANVILRINFTSDNLESVKDIYEDLATVPDNMKSRIKIDLQRVWQDRKTRKDHTEGEALETRHMFTEHGFIVVPNYIPSNVRQPCYGDKKNHILINFDGKLFGCTARDFNDRYSIGYLSGTGELIIDRERADRRRKAKFSKTICKTCRIAPLCGGGCCQRAMEASDKDICIYNYSEKDKDDIVLDIFERCFCR